MVVGQDFADAKTFRKDRGRIEPKDESFIYPTNKNLNYLFEEGLGIKIGHPSKPNKSEKLFFTNALIGLKTEGGMQGEIKAHWVVDSAVNFLKPLIDIVSPKAIIALGQIPFQAIYSIFKNDIKPSPFMNVPFKEHLGKFYLINNRIKVFPVYHCGARGVNINRELKYQVEDWKKIRQAISS
jgi:DNA polymerase